MSLRYPAAWLSLYVHPIRRARTEDDAVLRLARGEGLECRDGGVCGCIQRAIEMSKLSDYGDILILGYADIIVRRRGGGLSLLSENGRGHCHADDCGDCEFRYFHWTLLTTTTALPGRYSHNR